MNSNILNSLPQYIFQNEHDKLDSINKLEMKNDDDVTLNMANSELSEYPIEIHQNQEHIVNKYINNK